MSVTTSTPAPCSQCRRGGPENLEIQCFSTRDGRMKAIYCRNCGRQGMRRLKIMDAVMIWNEVNHGSDDE